MKLTDLSPETRALIAIEKALAALSVPEQQRVAVMLYSRLYPSFFREPPKDAAESDAR